MNLIFLSTACKTRGFAILPSTTSTLIFKRTSHARIFHQHAAAPVTTPPLPSPATATTTTTTTTTALSATRKTTQTLESQKQQQPTTESIDNIYSINCPPTDPTVLHSVVTKHREALDKFLTNKPIAAHTRDAFQQTKDSIQGILSKREIDRKYDNSESHQPPGIILDSGCGTGKSSLLLGKLYPNHIIIGIDRSLARLNRSNVYRNNNSNSSNADKPQKEEQEDPTTTTKEDQPDKQQGGDGTGTGDNTIIKSSSRELVQSMGNVVLVRAELVDFWRCCLLEQQQQQQQEQEQRSAHNDDDDEIPTGSLLSWSNIDAHYLLYPNPYPKKSRLQSRWYGHPGFPLLFHLLENGHSPDNTTTNNKTRKVVVRSNWKTYLQEFEQSTQILHENNNRFSYQSIDGVQQRDPSQQAAWTNFEQKYDKAGESTYELILEQHRCIASKHQP